MGRQISMGSRKELIEAVRTRYEHANRAEKARILDEFTAVAGYHRKHAIRALNAEGRQGKPERQRSRFYDEAVCQALVILWEAGDRVCGKRLKALIPILLASMAHFGHAVPTEEIQAKLLTISAATIDRHLAPIRAKIDGKSRRRIGVGSAIRRSIPVRTFADWNDPPPGFFEVDMVEHCGGRKYDGNFVHTLTLTDIASGWTECVAMPVRNQLLVVEGFAKVAAVLPFPMLGVDTDNDSAFMSETVFAYCKAKGLEQTRSRAYKKNDQAWVEQKNESVVRRLVGYGKLSGLQATRELANLYEASRLYINFFQPSFKLKSKTRDGARVRKKYHAPMTPCDRLLALPALDTHLKSALQAQFRSTDPVRLLETIRSCQKRLAGLSTEPLVVLPDTAHTSDLSCFLQSLSDAWKEGDSRPTHRKSAAKTHWWRSRVDPFEHVWPQVIEWLHADRSLNAKDLLDRLSQAAPDAYPGTATLRTLQRRIKQWRAEQVKIMIFGPEILPPGESNVGASAPTLPQKEMEATTI